MNKNMFLAVCAVLAALILLDGYCVYIHDLDHASDAVEEGSFLKFGHFDYALIEDGLAIGLIGLAALVFKGGCVRSMGCSVCLCLAGLLLGVEFFSQLGILTSEDQTVLSSAGSITRVFGVLLSAFASMASIILGLTVSLPETSTD